MKNRDQYAYPICTTEHTGFTPTYEKIFTTVVDGGLTKREMFAMHAMQGLITAHPNWTPETIAKSAIRRADELLKQLEPKNK